MQKRALKLLLHLTFLFSIGILPTVSQSVNTQLSVADSLFESRRYTQSYSLYQEIYNSGKATPAMLLKMAYSQEAQDNLGNALVYLHDYYRFTSDDRVIKKMQDLAQVNALIGYEQTEYQRFQKVLQDYRYLIFLVLVAFSGIVLFMMFKKSQKHQERSFSLIISLVLILVVAVYILNFTTEENKGIIMQDDAYIMTGPSAASELLEVAEQGHKVEILDQQDIWVEIKWRGKTAFIRESNIKALL